MSAELTKYAYDQLKSIPGLTLYGPPPERYPRVGVISFNLEGIPHGLVAAYLSFEAGIGVPGTAVSAPVLMSIIF